MEGGNYDNIGSVFFNNPTKKFYIREIARISGLNPNTVLNISGALIKEGLIKREKKKHIVELSSNTNEVFREKKRIFNFQKISESGIIGFLKEKFDPEAISVIGSYSRGEDIENSDIDLVVISKKDYKTLNLSKFEKILNRKIHLIITYYNKMSNEFYINLINGFILWGYINKK